MTMQGPLKKGETSSTTVEKGPLPAAYERLLSRLPLVTLNTVRFLFLRGFCFLEFS